MKQRSNSVFDRLVADSTKGRTKRGERVIRPPTGLSTMQRKSLKQTDLLLIHHTNSQQMVRSKSIELAAAKKQNEKPPANIMYSPELVSSVNLASELSALPKRKLMILQPMNKHPIPVNMTTYDTMPTKEDMRTISKTLKSVQEFEIKNKTPVYPENGVYKINDLLPPTRPL